MSNDIFLSEGSANIELPRGINDERIVVRVESNGLVAVEINGRDFYTCTPVIHGLRQFYYDANETGPEIDGANRFGNPQA